MIDNPRFPDKIKITRTTYKDNSPSSGSPLGGVDFSKVEKQTVVILESECDNYRTTRPKNTAEGVYLSDYTVALPVTDVILQEGDDIEVISKARVLRGKVKDFDYYNLGTTIWWDRNTN